MNSLAVGIVGVLAVFTALIWLHHSQYSRQLCITAIGREDKHQVELSRVLTEIRVPIALSVLFIVACISLYSQLGRYSEWDTGVADENIDYLIAADINRNARIVNEQPKNEMALLTLAQAYAEGGLYRESVTTLDELLALSGEDAALLGMKATAMYYRDNRVMSLDINLVLARALALDEFEFQAHLLIATHAYLNGRYNLAIEHWQQLLLSDSQSFNRDSINNAILKAEQKITNRL